MSRPTEKPLARASEHLASARYAEAAGAFRAVLRIDPNEFQAHFGLADALSARGQTDEAIEGLVEAAEACSEQDDHAAALTLYGKALAMDGNRLELHLDVAMSEASLGREEAAQARLDHLAEIYMQAGRTDEAAEVYRFLASWEEAEDEEPDEAVEPDEVVEEVVAEPPAHEPMAQQTMPTMQQQDIATELPTEQQAAAAATRAVPIMVPTTETVVVPTILVTPDGQLMQMPINEQSGRYTIPVPPAPAPDPAEDSSEKRITQVPVELIEAAQSAPVDLAAGTPLQDVEGTVVAFPPPPPELSEEIKLATSELAREQLEAAVVAAMENLAEFEREEDEETRVVRLPRKGAPPVATVVRKHVKTIAPASRPSGDRAPGPAPSDPSQRGADSGRARPPAGSPRPRVDRAPDGKVRLSRAPRPKGAAPRPASPPAGASRRDAGPPAQGRPPGPAQRGQPPPRGGPGKPPVRRSKPGAPPQRQGRPPGPAPVQQRRAPPQGQARPKPKRPDNPLVDRLRKRAGLGEKQRARARAAQPRATEPITVRPDGTRGPAVDDESGEG